eukprot:7383104-Prymnesium_polylepis.2
MAGLFISCGNISSMEAPPTGEAPAVHLDAAASYELVQALLGECTSAPLVYEHKWRARDFAIWDNRLLLHAPCKVPGTIGERLHHRVRLDGGDAANADLRPRVSLKADVPAGKASHTVLRTVPGLEAIVPEQPLPEVDRALSALETSGFCIISDVIPAGEVTSVRESVLQSTAEHRNPNAPPTIGHVPGLIRYNQSFAPYLSDPKVMDLVEALFGMDAKITFTTGQTNYPECQRQEWHSDWPFNQSGTAHIKAPYADAACHLTCVANRITTSQENGTILLRGSHKAPLNPSVPGVQDPTTPHPHEIRATGKAGSVLIIDSRLWHCIPPNPTPKARVAFAVRYAPWWLDTSVVMPGSAARARIVDGVGGKVDAGSSHAGIPLGNPEQPPIPVD